MATAKNAPPKKVLPWNINIHSAVAVYVQIENQIRFAMSAGKLEVGDQLPSVRELSDELKVNPNTVTKAYRDLEVMEYVYTRRGMGVFVAEGAPGKAKKQMTRYVQGRVGEIAREARAAGFKQDALLGLVRSAFKKGANEPIYLD